jgi:hypothetical protein
MIEQSAAGTSSDTIPSSKRSSSFWGTLQPKGQKKKNEEKAKKLKDLIPSLRYNP